MLKIDHSKDYDVSFLSSKKYYNSQEFVYAQTITSYDLNAIVTIWSNSATFEQMSQVLLDEADLIDKVNVFAVINDFREMTFNPYTLFEFNMNIWRPKMTEIGTRFSAIVLREDLMYKLSSVSYQKEVLSKGKDLMSSKVFNNPADVLKWFKENKVY